jgi:ankyrin repeat protein
MTRPEPLKKNDPLVWSPGTGVEVWDMFRAAMAGDVDTLRQLLDKNAALVRCMYEYRTPLYFAVRENQVQAAALLLERGADPAKGLIHDTLLVMARDRGYGRMQQLLEDRLGVSPQGAAIFAAILDRDVARVRSLLDASPEALHAGDERSNKPIHWAVMTRQIDLIDELVARGADLNAPRSDGARPIQLTSGDYFHRGWRDVPEETASTPADVLAHLSARGAYCDICTAASIGDVNRVTELLNQDPALANRVSDYVTYYACSGAPLRNAAAEGHMEIVKLLLEHGADPNLPEEGIAPYGGALYAAVAGGHFEIAQLLLERGANPNAAVESSADCLSRAINRGDQKMIDILASYGASRSVEIMAYYGDLRTAAAVFAANPSLANDPEALSNAAREGQDAFVRLMLRYQPDLARHVAVAAKTRELTEYLFQRGMDPSRSDWLGITPLHRFAERGDLESAALFVERGANVNARDEELCSTPLGCAAKAGKLAMVEMLLARGAKTNLPDDPEWATPLAWATRRGHADVIEMLRRAGAKA